MTKISRIVNANVYLDGGSLLGICEEVSIPDLKPTMSDHKALGMVGKIELPTGIDKLEAKFKWSSFDESLMGKTHNVFQAFPITVRGNKENYQGGERVSETAVKVFLKGTFKSPGGLNFKHQDNVEQESMFNVTYMKMEVEGNVVYEYDAMANIYIVDGVDLLATYRANLAI